MSLTNQVNVTSGGSTLSISWHIEPCQCSSGKIDLALAALKTLLQKATDMSGTIEDLTARVAANTTVIGSAIDLLHGLKAKLDAAGTDPQALAALSAELGSRDQELADAIVQSTPAQDTPPQPTPV